MWTVLIFLSLYFQFCRGQNYVGEFYYPPGLEATTDTANDLIWNVGDVKSINFTTTYSNYTIGLWQTLSDGSNKYAGSVFGAFDSSVLFMYLRKIKRWWSYLT